MNPVNKTQRGQKRTRKEQARALSSSPCLFSDSPEPTEDVSASASAAPKAVSDLDSNELWQSIPEDWRQFLKPAIDATRFLELAAKVAREYERGPVFPARPHIFRALELCPVDRVGVVVVGQDPYHAPGQANGLAFSCDMEPLQPSLRNILEEVRRNCSDSTPGGGNPEVQQGDLTAWAKQGVLLLNTALTVRAHQANSHRDLGWTWFTTAVLRRLSTHKSHLVFLLWGKPARELVAPFLGPPTTRTSQQHRVLRSSHPSPLSVDTATASAPAFRGCGHFQQCNAYRREHHLAPIQW